jgi:hypothetical protein
MLFTVAPPSERADGANKRKLKTTIAPTSHDAVVAPEIDVRSSTPCFIPLIATTPLDPITSESRTNLLKTDVPRLTLRGY